MLCVAFAPLLAVFFDLGAITNRVQKQKSQPKEVANPEKIVHWFAIRVAVVAVSLLALFLIFLVIRYRMT